MVLETLLFINSTILNNEPSFTEIGYEKISPYHIHTLKINMNHQTYFHPDLSIQSYHRVNHQQDLYTIQSIYKGTEILRKRDLFLPQQYTSLGFTWTLPDKSYSLLLGQSFDQHYLGAQAYISGLRQEVSSRAIIYQYNLSGLESFSMGYSTHEHWQFSWTSHLRRTSWSLKYRSQHQEFAIQICISAFPKNEITLSQEIETQTLRSGASWRYFPSGLIKLP